MFCELLQLTAIVIFGVWAFRIFAELVTPPDPLAGEFRLVRRSRTWIVRRLFALWQLAWEARWVVAAFLVVPLTHCLVVLHGVEPVEAVKIAGLILQVLGLLLVMWQLVKLREQFNQQPYTALVVGWFSRLGRALGFSKGRRVDLSATDGIAISATAVDGELWRVLRPDESLSLQEQIRHLANVLENRDNTYDQRFKKLRERQDETNKQIAAAVDSSNRARRELSQAIQKATVGDHALELLGIFWLVVGVVFATVPEWFSAIVN